MRNLRARMMQSWGDEMPAGFQPSTTIQMPPEGFGGMDTSTEPTGIHFARARRLYNAYQGRLGALTKRPGSVPVIETALPNPITHLTIHPFGTDQLLAVSDTSIYKYESDDLTSVTMTNTLNSSNVYDADFTGMDSNGDLVNIKIIADGGILKQYDGSEVKDITPATDDSNPSPANLLTDINSLGVKYAWTHSNYVFVNCGDNQIFYSKQATQGGNGNQYDYFPETHYTILVRKGDYVTGPGMPFDDVCFIPMRQGWNVVTGTNFNDFNFGSYLNTIDGVIAPRSPQIITYVDGSQTIAYLSDNGVNEIFTTILDNRGKQYATRNIMTNKIDWEAFGFTDTEMAAAISKYIVSLNMYLLEITRDTTNYVFGYDTKNGEWHMWTGLQINSLIEFDGVIYFAGNDGLLKRFDKSLYTDWDDIDKTTGTPIDFDRISGMIAFEESGYPSMLDYIIIKLRQYDIVASLDVSLVYSRSIVESQEAIRNYYLTWDVGLWDEAAWANLEYTDLVAPPQRLSTKLKLPKSGYYFQIRMRNDRDEPVEIYGLSLIGRTSGE